MTFAMIQKSDDYEQVESYIAKPYFLQQVMDENTAGGHSQRL